MRCRHDLEQDSCADCRVPDWAALWELACAEYGPWLVSRYDGRCRGCGAVFEAGELIRYYAPEGGYVAECCGVSSD